MLSMTGSGVVRKEVQAGIECEQDPVEEPDPMSSMGRAPKRGSRAKIAYEKGRKKSNKLKGPEGDHVKSKASTERGAVPEVSALNSRGQHA